MATIIDYAVAYTSIANPTTNLSGTFSVDVDTLTVTAVNITITDGANPFTFSTSDARGLFPYPGNSQFQLELRTLNAEAYIDYNDTTPYGNPTINFVNGGNRFNGFSPGVFYGITADEGNVVQGSTIPAFCFTRDTLISTPTGSTPVQDLHIGDLILNHLGQSVPVKWIGRQRIHPAFAGDSLPICIRQGALGNDLPLRDLYVSPGHAMYIDDCLLIDAKALVNGTTITQVTQWEGDVEYFHIETQNHEIILAEGTPAETFMDNVSRACFNNYSEYQALYPEAKDMIELDIPRVSHQRQLPNTIKHKLEAISEVLMGEDNGIKERMVG